MSEALTMLAAGLILGALYFGGLWISVRLALRRRAPHILGISRTARLIGVGAAMLLLEAVRPEAVVPILLGMLASRTALIAIVEGSAHAA